MSFRTHIFVFTCILSLTPSLAFAYLDPASGNALIYLLVSIFAGAAYTIKGMYYRLIGKKQTKQDAAVTQSTEAPIAILSEGALYWSTFQPIIDELIKRQQHFAYYSLDVADPALEIDNQYMHAKFLGNGAWGLSKACRLTNPVVLSTTPNIGTENYPISRSPFTKKLIHVFHSMLDIADYHKGSLDTYDEVYLVGDFQRHSIREIEQKRNLPAKKLTTLGLPYFDTMRVAEPSESSHSSTKTVLIAPSWGGKSCLAAFGTHFIHALAQAGFHIIIRPHPHSFRIEKDRITEMQRELSVYNNVEWDTALSNAESLSRADCMISDVSSVRFDFAFFQKKPVITCEIPQETMVGFEMDDLSSTNLYAMNELIGTGITEEELGSIVQVVQHVLETFTPDKVDALRDSSVANFLCASNAICDELIATAQTLSQ
ncbi:MAG: CDP-glycerol glycerophosphotransferase family protein [Desulfovibrionales bacterium]|nr:CDP-glycerol glycerophosphotransferase family protein [Desulfovibrionales bacterium]